MDIGLNQTGLYVEHREVGRRRKKGRKSSKKWTTHLWQENGTANVAIMVGL